MRISVSWSWGALHSQDTCMLVFPLLLSFLFWHILDAFYLFQNLELLYQRIKMYFRMPRCLRLIFVSKVADLFSWTAVYKRGSLVTACCWHSHMVRPLPVPVGWTSRRPIHFRVAVPKEECGGVFQPCERLVVHDSSYAGGSPTPGKILQPDGRSFTRGI